MSHTSFSSFNELSGDFRLTFVRSSLFPTELERHCNIGVFRKVSPVESVTYR